MDQIVSNLARAWTIAEQEIVQLMADKGYNARCRIDRDYSFFSYRLEVIGADPLPRAYFYGKDLAEAHDRVAEAIGKLEHADACAPWFDEKHPINQPGPFEDYLAIKRAYESDAITGETALRLLREIGHEGAPWLTEAA